MGGASLLMTDKDTGAKITGIFETFCESERKSKCLLQSQHIIFKISQLKKEILVNSYTTRIFAIIF